MPKKKQVKVLKTRFPVTCNLSEPEYRKIQSELMALNKTMGMDIKLSAYAKHALLSHAPHRRMLSDIRALLHAEQNGGAPIGGGSFLDNLERALMEPS